MKRLDSFVSRAGIIAIVSTAALLWAWAGLAQEKPGDRVRSLSDRVLQIYEQLQSAPGIAANLRVQATALLQERAAALQSVVEENPAEALRLAWPADLLSEIGATVPAGRQHLESHGRWEGPIEYVIQDSEDLRAHRNIRHMTVRGRSFRFNLPAQNQQD